MAATATAAFAALPKMKITRVRVLAPPNPNPLFNQSDLVVLVDTDAGLTGIGEGGSKDQLDQCAGRVIGRDPQHIEQLWQDMSRSFFYPPGREKVDALGALDLALWDIKGKVQSMPVHEVLGGMVRNYCECYNTAGNIPGVEAGMGIKDRARLTIEAGYRAFRMGRPTVPSIPPSTLTSVSTSSTKTASRPAMASVRTATGASTFTSASIFPKQCADAA